MKSNFSVGICLLFVLFSCTKNPPENNSVNHENNYYPLTTGSYWIYNTYKIDSLKNETLVSQNDTLNIIGDTNINGYQYKIFFGKVWPFFELKPERYCRDSLGYIVDASGKILFSSNNFTDTLSQESIPTIEDTLYYEYSRMKQFSEKVYLQSGTYDSVLNLERIFIYWNIPERLTVRLKSLYAPNVGCILRQSLVSNEYLDRKEFYEIRLAAYHIVKN